MAAKSILDSFIADQGYALFEYAESGIFRPVGEYPAWCQKLWKNAVTRDNSIRLAEASPLLENFLVDAEAFWNSNRDGSTNSPVWIERDSAGKEVPLEAAALHLDGKNILLLRNLSRTYADRQKLYQTARDALLEHERLRRETQKKEILLHCIVHDLSQPLTAMRGCFSLLALEDLSAELRRTVETGQRESIRQEQMIRGILQAFSADLAGAQTSADTAPGAADIAACAQRVIQEFSPAFGEKQIKLQLDPAVDPTHDWIVAADESRLERIFGNLLENALRYSPLKTTVTIGLEEKDKQVLAFVDDQGPGLPKDQSQEQMFALFGKGKDKPGKAGLGLYFCKITVERWGGTIDAETKTTGGTRFWFRLPRPAKSARDAAKKEAPRPPDAATGAKETPAAGPRPRLDKPAKSLRILVAEDTDENRELVSELLQRRGHAVVAVSDGRKALEALAKDSYDVVLMDEQMPVMDGLEATRAIRAKEKSTGKRQVIVALTGNVTEEDTQRRIEAGMDGFVPKPFEMNALFETIEFLGTFGNQVIGAGKPPSKTPPSAESAAAQTQPKAAAPAAAPLAVPFKDVATSLHLATGGNKKLAASLTKSFLTDAPKRLATIRAALGAKDPKALGAAAHALKGSAGIFGAPATVAAARKLEAMGKNRNLAGVDDAFRSLEAAMKDLQSELASLTAPKKKPKAEVDTKGRRKK
jgi:signal transduction histidine kinase/DNA-binding NarL/FixJ family response regulator/HPt (histidine-containing phosphotransfer) domain-containing protein